MPINYLLDNETTFPVEMESSELWRRLQEMKEYRASQGAVPEDWGYSEYMLDDLSETIMRKNFNA